MIDLVYVRAKARTYQPAEKSDSPQIGQQLDIQPKLLNSFAAMLLQIRQQSFIR
jgi:hypothetical protein